MVSHEKVARHQCRDAIVSMTGERDDWATIHWNRLRWPFHNEEGPHQETDSSQDISRSLCVLQHQGCTLRGSL